ncbi:MAG: hypothetical protein FD169_1812 [Bacillota bacterium]|nr:MAG: hypothetical protein FD169_1812 [Bacillota bacterium]MBS3951286.1 DUF370 domain-containing protein [Peptococcaceae bacterium]
MYLHIGGDVIIPFKEVVGIFDSITSDATATREFLQVSREEGFIFSATDITHVKSFIIVNDRVYLSPIACATLRKRWFSLIFSIEEL